MSTKYVVISASEGEAFLRREGEFSDTVEQAVAVRDELMRKSQAGRVMLAAARPTAKPSPRFFAILTMESDDSVVLSAEESGHAAARAASMTAPRGAAPPAPVPLSKITEGTAGAYPREEKAAD